MNFTTLQDFEQHFDAVTGVPPDSLHVQVLADDTSDVVRAVVGSDTFTLTGVSDAGRQGRVRLDVSRE